MDTEPGHEPAPDEWDRLYNVDFSIEVNGKYIGIQIKPVTQEGYQEHRDRRRHRKGDSEVEGIGSHAFRLGKLGGTRTGEIPPLGGLSNGF
jgi:hypothetical protein